MKKITVWGAAILCAVATGGEIFVNGETGDDLRKSGKLPDDAFKTIQKGIDSATPGDSVIVLPGVYFENPVFRRGGKAGKPVVLRADKVKRGRVVISAADPDIRSGRRRFELEDRKIGLYSIAFPHNPARVLYSGTDMMPYSSLECLKKFQLLNGAPAARHGFYFDPAKKKLYVRLHPDGKYGSTDPNNHVMAVGAPNSPGYNGERINRREHGNLMIDFTGPAHIVIDGFTFETPGGAAVVTRAGDVVVRNAWFDGCRFGVYGALNSSLFGAGRPEGLPDRVIVEHSFYHHYPAFDDVAELIREYRDTEVMTKYPIFWWHRKGVGSDPNIMKNYETGIAGGIGADWEIRRNLINNAFEGLSVWGNSWSVNLKIYGNRFENIVDNAIEAESHARNMHFFDNVIRNTFEPVSWQPEDGTPWPGPVYIYRNIIWADRKFQKLWPWRPGCFKLGATDRNWTQPLMGKVPAGEPRSRVSKRFVAVPGDGFTVFNNTIYVPHMNLFNTLEMESAKPVRELANFRFFNNIIVTGAFHKRKNYEGGLLEFSNNLVVEMDSAKQSRIAAGFDGQVLPDAGALKLAAPENGDFRPSENSPVKGNGTLGYGIPGSAPDIGALSPGGAAPDGKAGPQEDL